MVEMSRAFLPVRLLAAALLTAGCGSTIEPSGPDLGGHWRGLAEIVGGSFSSPLDRTTPLDMTLRDDGGRLTGTGGGVDCRYFTYCGSFGTYSVVGSHDGERIRLQGTSIYGPTWTLEGRLAADGTLSGLVAGTEVPSSSWRMTRVP